MVEAEICRNIWELAALVRLDAGVRYYSMGSIHQAVNDLEHHGELGFCPSVFQ